MAETLYPRSPEKQPPNEVAEVAGEQLKKLERRGETFDESSQEHNAEHARKQAELEAVFGKETGSEHRSGGEPDASQPKIVTRKTKEAEYKKTMQSVQSQMSKPSRAFSKFIHNPGIEKASDVTANTVARPNAILAGSFTAFITVLAVYLIAQYIGFRLSGFETIAAFVGGWILGMVLDLLRVSFQRRQSS